MAEALKKVCTKGQNLFLKGGAVFCKLNLPSLRKCQKKFSNLLFHESSITLRIVTEEKKFLGNQLKLSNDST